VNELKGFSSIDRLIAFYYLGPENVMVVNAEDLDVRNMTRVRNMMNRVFEFAGLCPFEIPDMDMALQV